MTSGALSLVAFALLACPACSSSSSPTGDAGATIDTGVAADTAATDTGGGADTAVATDTGSADDADETGTTIPDAGPSKCAKVTCSGAYQKCCPATGACYDTRTGTCY